MDRLSDQSNAFVVQLGGTTVNEALALRGIAANQTLRDDCSPFIVDDGGYMYCSGVTNGNLGDQNAAVGSADIYVAKFAPDGSLVWITQAGLNDKPAGGTGAGEQSCLGIALDSDKNIYCAASTTSDFTGTGYTGGARDALLVKFDRNGVLQWARQFGTTAEDRLNRVTVTPAGDVIAVGYTYGEYVGSERPTARADIDVFLVKFSSAGVLSATRQLGEASLSLAAVNANEFAHSIVIAQDGNVLISVGTEGSLAATNPTPGDSDIVLWKIDTSLNTLWLKQYPYSGSDRIIDLRPSDDGGHIGGGYTEDSITESSGGGFDALLVKFDSAGNITKMSQLGGATRVPGSTLHDDFCEKLTIDRDQSIYCAGTTSGDFAERNGDSSHLTYDVFIAKWDKNLNFQTAIQFGGETSVPGGNLSRNEYVGGIYIDYFGNLHLGGMTEGAFGEANADTVAPYTLDLFIFKMDMSTLRLGRPAF